MFIEISKNKNKEIPSFGTQHLYCLVCCPLPRPTACRNSLPLCHPLSAPLRLSKIEFFFLQKGKQINRPIHLRKLIIIQEIKANFYSLTS